MRRDPDKQAFALRGANACFGDAMQQRTIRLFDGRNARGGVDAIGRTGRRGSIVVGPHDCRSLVGQTRPHPGSTVCACGPSAQAVLFEGPRSDPGSLR